MRVAAAVARLAVPLVLIAIAIAIATSACATYRDELARSQRSFDRNDHDRALALLRDLEPDLTRLSLADQTHYAYLRGMTDYRIGHRSDARHWLALAKAYDEASPGVLPADWKSRTSEALEEMNRVVYSEGTKALATPRPTQQGPTQ